MFRLALRSLGARKLRAAATGFAVFLGVTLMAGSYVLTDTIDRSFEQIFSESYEGVDVVLSPLEKVRQEAREPPAFGAALLAKVRALPEVEQAEGSIFSNVRILDTKGNPLGSQFAPNFASSSLPERFETLTYTGGRAPANAGEVALDKAAAERKNLKLGDRIRVAGERAARSYRIVGLVQLGDASFGGAVIAELVHAEAQRVTGKRGKLDQIFVAGPSDTPPDAVARAVRRAVPPGIQVETGTQAAARESADIGHDLSFLKTTLLVFSGIALFVGAFLIFNTFSITVAQRTREFGMLRTLGASRRQILSSVVAEALLLGLIGSAAGVVAGVLFAGAINSLLKSFGVDLPNTGTVLATRTITVSLIVGTIVTLAAGLVPALRATRVTPMAALREEVRRPTRGQRRITVAAAAVLILIGGVLVCIGLFGGIESSGDAAGLIGGGAVAAVFGVALVSPRLVRPLALLVGIPIERLRGVTGRLARENSMRKPGRTAVTAAALMIGLGLVSFVTIFAEGVEGSIDRAIDRNVAGELSIQNKDNFTPIPEDVEREVARVPGVATASSVATGEAVIDGVPGQKRVAGLDPRTSDAVLNLEFVDAKYDLKTLGRNEALIDRGLKTTTGIRPGKTFTLTTPTNTRATYRAVAQIKDNADFLGDLVLTQDALREDFGESKPLVTYVRFRDGADHEAVEARIERLVGDRFPSAEVLNQEQLKQRQSESLNQLLGLIYALLSLAVVVSVFGIVNTLALSIYERTRELGMLRAIGMSRAQVRRVIRYESVITSLIGAVLGMGLGLVFAALISRPLADEGFTFALPLGALIMLLILAALAGVLAAILPARRAARLDILQALAYE